MPILNQYTENSDKSGYYIRANVGGDTPITLQVSALAAQLFRLLDYNPDEEVPSKLVWNMYDVGLVYTLNSLASLQETSSTDNSASFLEQLDLDSSLSADEQEEIVAQLKEYDGPDPEKVEELIERFEGRSNTEDTVDADEAVPLLQKWAKNPEKYDQLKKTVNSFEEFASISIQTFARHPYLASPPIWLQDDGTIQYELSREKYSQSIFIQDCRMRPGKADYRVILEHTNGGREVAEATSTGNRLTYENNAGRRGNRIRLDGMLDWIIPADEIEVDVPETDEMIRAAGGFLTYDGKELEVIRKDKTVNEEDLLLGTVDRISGSGNPVVELEDEDGYLIVDQGEPGEEYLIERIRTQRGRVLSRVKSDTAE